MFKTQKYLFTVGAILLLIAGAAHAVTVPSKSVVNPITQTLYVPNNGAAPATIRVYERTETPNKGWTENTSKTISMPLNIPKSTAKIFGLAVSSDGKRLLVSVSNSTQSKLRVINLDAYGLPTGSAPFFDFTDAGGWTPTTFDNPAGIALADNRVYMADSLTNQIRYFDYDGSNWTWSGKITEGLTSLGMLYDVAIGPIQNTYQQVPMGGKILLSKKYLIFVSRKANISSTKELFVYQYSWTLSGGETITLVNSFDLQFPTYMTVVDNMLYVSVNGTNGDVMAYSISDADPYLNAVGMISSGVNNAWGWTGIAVTPDKSRLYFTQAQSSTESSAGLYKVALPVTGDTTANLVTGISQADGVCVSPDGARIASTYSGTGNITLIDSSSDPSLTYNQPVLTAISPSSTTYGTGKYVVVTGKYFVNSQGEIKTEAWLRYNTPYPIENVEIDSSTQLHGYINGIASDGARPYIGYIINKDLNSNAPDNTLQSTDVNGAFTINFTKPQNLKGYANDGATPTPNPLFGGQIRWTWDPNNQGENFYDLVSDTGAVIKSVSTPTNTYTEPSLTPNTQYSRKVRVRFNTDLSADGDLVTVYSSAATPSISTISAEGTPVVHLSFATGGNPAGTNYEVWGSADATNFTLVGTTTATVYNDTVVTNGATFSYKVRALNGDGQPSSFSPTKSILVPLTQLPPNDPTNLRQYNGTTLIPDQGRTTSGSLTFKFMLSDPNGSSTNTEIITPHVRIDGAGDVTGAAQFYSGGAAIEGLVNINNITEGSHTWEAMASDSTNLPSKWVTGETFIIDKTAPTVLSTVPSNGATVADLNTTIKVTFSEALDPTTVSTLQFILNENGAVKARSVAYDDPTHTVTITPTSPLTNGATEDVTVTTGVKDLAGNALAASYHFSFTAGTVESITVRSPSGTGWFVGKTFNITWESSGNISNVKIEWSKDSGTTWQNVAASVPNTGTYAWTIPLSANVQDYTDPSTPNRIRVSDASDAIPSGTSAGFAIFQDDNPPVLKGTIPASGETGVASNVTMVATFEDAFGLNPSTVNANNIRIDGGLNVTNITINQVRVGAKVTSTISFNADQPFSNGQVATVHLLGGASGIKDWATNPIADYSWSFTVGTTSGTPTVTSILPNTGTQSTTVAIVDLTGSNFASGAQVTLTRSGQTPIDATGEAVASALHMTCAIPIPAAAQIGTWDVTVTNPDTKYGTLPNGFTIYAAPGTGPVVNSINPNHGAQGSNVPVTIAGSNFQTGATVMLARVGQTPINGIVNSVSPPNSISASFNLPANAVVGLWSVIVTNPDNQQGVLYNGFNITSNPPSGLPTITMVYPQRGPNNKATDIRIIGTGFAAGNAVEIQTVPAVSLDNITVNSATMISATVPAGVTPVGIYHITVTNSNGASDQTAADTFEVMNGNEQPPVASQITNFTASGESGQVRLDWTNPTDNDMATIEVRRYTGGFPAAYDPTGTLIFTDIPAPGATNEVVDTNVTNGTTYYYVAFIRDTSGNMSAVDFTAPGVNAASATPSGANPTVTSILPNTGTQNTTVAIVDLTGSNFASGAQVTLTRSGQTPIDASGEVVPSALHITCAIPIPATAQVGTWDVTVTNPDTKYGTLPNGFTIYAAPGTGPVVNSINPNHGAQGSNVPVTIAGSNFQTGATVILARVGQPNITGNVTSVTPPNSISASFNLPANAVVGLWSVIVTNPDNQQGVLYNGFNITSNPPSGLPTITKVYPQRGPNNKATDIRIIGTGFAAGNLVEIQATPAVSLDNVTVNSATMISATVPAGVTPIGIYHITVTNSNGASDRTAADTFEVMNGNEQPPVASQITNFTASGESGQVRLDWTNPTDNDMATIEVRRYTGGFPAAYDPTGTLVFTDIPAPGATNEVVDTNVTNGTTYYYVAFIRDTSGNMSAVDFTAPGVNAASATPGGINEPNPPITLIYDATRGNIFWIAVPYNTADRTASAIIKRINNENGKADTSGEIITSIGRWNGTVNPQVYDSFDYLGALGWSGNDFDVNTGEALYLNIAQTVTCTLEGTNDPNFAFNLPFDGTRGNIFWVSLPYKGNYTSAEAIIADINTSAGLPADSGALVSSIGRWDGTANPQVYQSYDYLGALGWSGTNFTFQPTEGYYINIAGNLSNWKPQVK